MYWRHLFSYSPVSMDDPPSPYDLGTLCSLHDVVESAPSSERQRGVPLFKTSLSRQDVFVLVFTWTVHHQCIVLVCNSTSATQESRGLITLERYALFVNLSTNVRNKRMTGVYDYPWWTFVTKNKLYMLMRGNKPVHFIWLTTPFVYPAQRSVFDCFFVYNPGEWMTVWGRGIVRVSDE